MRVKIEDQIYTVRSVVDYGYLPIVEMEDGTEWYLAKDAEHPGEKAAEYWKDLARNDPEEFVELIGEKRLVQWVLGHSDDFGVSSFEEFLKVVAKHPEKEFSGYDEKEYKVTKVGELVRELDFVPTVAYRLD